MRRLFICILVFLFYGVVACSNFEQKQNHLSLISINDTLHYVQIENGKSIDKWELPYPVFQFQVGDINNNGDKEILVGVIKTTRFDTILGKRIFIFKNYNGYVRPLWLGSRLGQELENFRFIANINGGRIRSVEREKNGNYIVAEYEWRKFGLEFISYLGKELSRNDAFELLNK